MGEIKNYYSARAEERRRQFNAIINKMDMVLINNITQVDDNIFYSFEGDNTPMGNGECVEDEEDGVVQCSTHMAVMGPYGECDEYESESEVYQWFAVNEGDANYLKDHGQYIAYSDALDTYFLAITHFGTSWDHVDSMVEAFRDSYHGLEDFADESAE